MALFATPRSLTAPSPSLPTQSGYLPLTNHHNRMYTAQITVGTPPQPFNVVIDTGSSDTWLITNAITHPHQPYIHYYTPAASTTYIHTDTPIHITYGKGTVAGDVIHDTLTIANYTITNATIGLIHTYTTDFDEMTLPLDGILGVGQPALATVKQYDTVMQALHRQGWISEQSTTFSLSSTPPYMLLGSQGHATTLRSQHQSSALLTSATGTQLITADVTSRRLWTIDVQHLAIDNDIILSTCTSDTPCTALIDTGTSFLTLSPPLYHTLASHIIQHRDDCAVTTDAVLCVDLSHDHLPNIGIVINGLQIAITPAHYHLDHTIGIMPVRSKHHTDNFIILGDVFITALDSIDINADTMQINLQAHTIPLSNHTRSIELVPMTHATPLQHLTRQWYTWHTVLVMFGVLFVLLIIGVPCVVWYKRRKLTYRPAVPLTNGVQNSSSTSALSSAHTTV